MAANILDIGIVFVKTCAPTLALTVHLIGHYAWQFGQILYSRI